MAERPVRQIPGTEVLTETSADGWPLSVTVIDTASYAEFERMLTEPFGCIHPGVFAAGPVPGTEYCARCDQDVSRHLL